MWRLQVRALHRLFHEVRPERADEGVADPPQALLEPAAAAAANSIFLVFSILVVILENSNSCHSQLDAPKF